MKRHITIAVFLTAVSLPFAAKPAAAAVAPSATTVPAELTKEAAIARADQLIASGLDYLKSKQHADGSWGEANQPPGITALALRSFAEAGQLPSNNPNVARGYDKLLSYQLDNGGIYKDLLANYNTAIALSALTAANEPKFKEPIDRAIAYLKGLQWTPDTKPEYQSKPGEKFPEQNEGKQVVKDEKNVFYGGWGYGHRSAGAGRPDLSNAQMTIEALHDANVSKDDPAMQRAIVFLSRCQNSSETNDQSWASNDGGFIYGPGVDGFGDSSAGAYVDAAGKHSLRSYGSMTYAGLKSMIFAGLTKDDPRVKAASSWIRANWTVDENPGMIFSGPDAAQSGLYYYYHTLARALAVNGEPTLTLADGKRVDWRTTLIAKIATLQRDDGSWSGDKRWMESDPVLVTSYCVQALVEARNDLKAKSE